MSDHDKNQFAIQRIYLKDASFEIPNAPAIFREDGQAENNMTMNTTINSLDNNTFEVVLSITLTSKIPDRTIYVAEVQQAGIFTITGFPEHERLRLLGTHCPHVLFAYAREAIGDLITKGSFPQVVLQPINFDALYVKHQQGLARRAPAAEEGEAMPTAGGRVLN
ncbi:preprotein translocase subunit SecB [Achromatium sp. WMS2]|nr:preprotein translocase subunit SecB [Achromatium sp. WMS2]